MQVLKGDGGTPLGLPLAIQEWWPVSIWICGSEAKEEDLDSRHRFEDHQHTDGN